MSSIKVWRGQREVVLTSLEFKLLQIFLEYPRSVLSKDTLLVWVWRGDISTSTDVVEVYVKQLRQKLEAVGEPRLLHSLRGAGYFLREAPACVRAIPLQLE
jgi:two-component system, OmpR family, response regulator MprA